MADKKLEEMNLIDLIDELEDFIEETGTPLRFSAGKISLEKDILDAMVDEIRVRIPSEISRGKEIMDTEESILDEAREKAAAMLAEAQSKAARIEADAMQEAEAAVEESEIVKMATLRAREIEGEANQYAEDTVAKAKADAKEIRLGAMNYTCDIVEGLEEYMHKVKETQTKLYENVLDAIQENLDDLYNNGNQVKNQIEVMKRD